VSIASASIKQNNLIMKKMMYTSAKSETKKYNRYYQEDMDRTRMEKLLVKYDKGDPYMQENAQIAGNASSGDSRVL
jgi:hypothetical protein